MSDADKFAHPWLAGLILAVLLWAAVAGFAVWVAWTLDHHPLLTVATCVVIAVAATAPRFVPRAQVVIHLAGYHVVLGGRLRQRCAWCGALLVDVELSAEVIGELTPTAMGSGWWMKAHGVVPAGVFVRQRRNGSWTEHRWSSAEPMPASACALVADEITAL